MIQQNTPSPAIRTIVISLQKAVLLLARHWYFVAMLLTIAILAAGFLAPAFMAEGYPEAGQRIYRFLRSQNHQLPQRSYFLFGKAGAVQSYSLEQVLEFGAEDERLEDFVGNAKVGYKTALNHRMIAIFVGIFIGGLIWGLNRQRPQLSFIWFLPLALPLIFDGLSHMISEGSGEGFRQTNAWAVAITANAFSQIFYQGTTVGTLNWLLRTVTGLLFGLGLAWWLFSYLSRRFMAVRLQLEPSLRKIGAIK
jgi:hypothetical protein